MASLLLVYVLLAPVAFGVLDASSRSRWFSIAGSVSSLLAIAGLWLEGQPTVISLPLLPLSYGSQPVGLLLASVTILVWLAISIFSRHYLRYEHNSSRFIRLLSFSVAGAISCFLARDFLAFLLGFELVSLASQGLVGHHSHLETQQAARLYQRLGHLSGVILIGGLAILAWQVNSLDYAQLNGIPLGISLLLSIGFAIKAGAFPLHFWLPKAHPVAPSPASALLSGILIKTGAYGILQVASLTAAPATFGLILLVIALITMGLGVVMALLQHDAKRMLAYHSVSQMGYILLGIALWAFEHNALGLGGAVFHMINHAVFKSALFLICGSAMLAANTTDIYRLGWLHQVFGLATPLVLLPALGIAGIPGFNGYISKTVLHSALASSKLPPILYRISDLVYIVVAFGTVCSFTKFSWFLFFADRKGEDEAHQPAAKVEVLGIGLLSIVALLLGLFPQPVLDALASELTTLGAPLPPYLDLFSGHALQSAWLTLGGGLVLYCLCYYTGLFHPHAAPLFSWNSLLKLVKPASKAGEVNHSK
ncbi:MAG: NADH dehydrogenase [Firmicutes bacterium]|nr:NADH dehydrogenase [Bacillota bacterium]